MALVGQCCGNPLEASILEAGSRALETDPLFIDTFAQETFRLTCCSKACLGKFCKISFRCGQDLVLAEKSICDSSDAGSAV
eukprot:3732680-Amphidinium_carterae.1